ncbi:MAG: hypothetical protein ACRCVN_03005 [Spirochaetia bacterium]
MTYIYHRINTINQLKKVPVDAGIEIDIRYHNDDLILHHDPFAHHKNQPEKLAQFLKHWQHKGPIILNVKTEGIEEECIKLMEHFNIKNWFFLDLSMPYFCLYVQKALNDSIRGFSSENLCVRYSEYEPIEYAISFSQKVKWVWVDCFTQLPLNTQVYSKLKEAGFHICLVSPELQKHEKLRISEFKNALNSIGKVDAICTKYPNIWHRED